MIDKRHNFLSSLADCRRDRSICDINASCARQGLDYICVCDDGYIGDGFTCNRESTEKILKFERCNN